MKTQKERIDTALVDTIAETVDDTILWTPIDTGNARYNWQTSIGTPETTTLTWMEDDSETSFVSAGVPSPAYYASLRNAEVDIDSAPDNVFYLVNNLDYIGLLEYGIISKQSHMLHKSLGLFELRLQENLRK